MVALGPEFMRGWRTPDGNPGNDDEQRPPPARSDGSLYQATLSRLLLNMIRFFTPLALTAVVFAGCTPASSDGTATDSGSSPGATAKPSKPKPTYTAAQE